MKKYLFEFEKFEIYQRAINFVSRVYNFKREFPDSEKFGLSSQLTRAAISKALNLAEGFGKYRRKEKIRFYHITRGSVHECIPALTISLNQKLIDKIEHSETYQQCFELSRRISGLINSNEKKELRNVICIILNGFNYDNNKNLTVMECTIES